MFHKGVRLISPSHMLLCCTVSVRQKGTTDSQHTLMEEMSACVHLIHACTHAHTHTLTCTVEEMLERERPSRSDSRL